MVRLIYNKIYRTTLGCVRTPRSTNYSKKFNPLSIILTAIGIKISYYWLIFILIVSLTVDDEFIGLRNI